ncbi:MAG: type I methionyl aminopeptidase, partial [Schleiferiaceae bacterium]|nr:type I methionyl aminopeptidase [Schleiferiaceae bacterium]
HRVRQLKDGWSIITSDGKPSAHFEHNVALVEGRPVVLSSFDPIYKALGIANNDPIFE